MSKNAQMIFEIVSSSFDHLTAEEIFIKAQKISPKIVRATVYNNVNRLVEEGKIRRLRFLGSVDRYDNVNPHDHLVCVSCGKIKDVKFGDFSKVLEETTGEDIQGYDLNVKYICKECKKPSTI